MTPTDRNTIYEHLKQGRFKEAERQAVRAIHREPLQAQYWVYLGEALLHQGNGRTAAKVFHRARLLDPQANWAAAVQQALSRAKPGDDRIDIEVMLDVKKVTVAAAVLARNEIRCIERCLSSLVDAVDEILVIDCYSTDGTAEAAAAFAKTKVVSFEWHDDFAAARNAGLPHIESDWVIWVDADETLLPEDAANIREAAGVYEAAGQPSILHGGVIDNKEGPPIADYDKGRMFALRQKCRFWGRVHEQIGPAAGGMYEGHFLRAPVLIRFYHDGYDPEIVVQKDKLQRNLKLLELMVREEPENPAWLLFYGRELLSAGERNKAEKALREAEAAAAVTPKFSRAPHIRMLLARIYMAKEDYGQAEAVCLKILEERPNFPDARYFLAQVNIRKAYKLLQEAETLARKAKEDTGSYRGMPAADHQIGIWKADAALAEIASMAGKPSAASFLYRQIAQRVPGHREALKRLGQIEEQRVLLNRMAVQTSGPGKENRT